jgi:ABC-type transport system substrate-binding protein
MRKIFIVILGFVFLFPRVPGALELDNKNLEGLNYARVQCEYNGVPFYKGYKSPKEQKVEEFNLEKAEATLNKAGIPIDKDHIRAVYNQMETLLKKAGIRVVEIRTSDDKAGSTILPTVSINVEVMEASGKMYFCLVSITVSKWISTWVGTENINTPMIAWWQKKMLVMAPNELNNSIEKAVKELIDDFTLQLKEANPEEEEKTDDG